ncbi:hypothetical protein KEM48_006821 [Puccinia striiformis f. sp. tritici PST-130]|nr:hypothetical protein KEM48_006821 [Puccinia striiformis f. sp. tritici PST-130]
MNKPASQVSSHSPSSDGLSSLISTCWFTTPHLTSSRSQPSFFLTLLRRTLYRSSVLALFPNTSNSAFHTLTHHPRKNPKAENRVHYKRFMFSFHKLNPTLQIL